MLYAAKFITISGYGYIVTLVFIYESIAKKGHQALLLSLHSLHWWSCCYLLRLYQWIL